MRRDNDLQFARWALMALGRLARLLSLLVQEAQHCGLKLRMKMRLRLFHQEERKIGVVYLSSSTAIVAM